MKTLSFAPQIAVAAGLPSRYRYWSGRSGQRYLFTGTDFASLLDFEDAVAIAVRDAAIVWAGEARAGTLLSVAARIANASFYMHLLAVTEADRRTIVDDLRPDAGSPLRAAA